MQEKQAVTTIMQQPKKQQVKAKLTVVDNVPYRGVVKRAYRKMGNGKTYNVPVQYTEPFMNTMADYGLSKNILRA